MLTQITRWAVLALCLATSAVCHAQDADAVQLLHDSGALQALLSMLPPSAASYVLAFAFAMPALSVALLGTKQLLVKYWRPADEWPRWLVYTLTGLDWLTIASASVRGLAKTHATHKALTAELTKLKSVPPAPDDVLFAEDDAEAVARRGWSKTPFAMLFALVLSVGALSNQGCAGPAESRARTALDVFAVTVEPAAITAREGCIAAERATVELARAGVLNEGATRERLETNRVICDHAQSIYNTIRALHTQAVAAAESGAIEAAQGYLTQMRAAWAELGQVGK